MSTRSPLALSGLLLLVALLIQACFFDGDPLEERQCLNDACPEGYYCLDNYCVLDDRDIPEEPDMEPDIVEEEPDMEDPLKFCIDDDNDGFFRNDDRCQLQPQEGVNCDSNGTINPNAEEICDGVDNNCDGLVDDNLSNSAEELARRMCPKQEGVCAGSMRRCVQGNYQDCDNEDYATHATNNNNTYAPDEAFCTLTGDAHLDDLGRCASGQSNVASIEEAEAMLCDMADNDCDGVVDEPEVNVPCYDVNLAPNLGEVDNLNAPFTACRAGTRTCVAGQYEGTCNNSVTPVDEDLDTTRCDSINNDCNVPEAGELNSDVIDEFCGCDPVGSTEACYTGNNRNDIGVGICKEGTRTCQPNNRFGLCEGDVVPGVESCSNMMPEGCEADPECSPSDYDDDCDGIVDNIRIEGIKHNYGESCGRAGTTYPARSTGKPGVCEVGRMLCNEEGTFECVSNVNEGDQPERCTDLNIDNDCDGNDLDVDLDADTPRDDIVLGDDCSTGREGICEAGLWSCTTGIGVYAVCDQINDALGSGFDRGNAELDEDGQAITCNGRDDDCDGEIDEDTDFTQTPNCGTCGTVCGNTQLCCPPTEGAAPTAYACTTTTAPDTVEGDRNNCGGCGFENPAARCDPDEVCCGTGCVDLDTNPNHCGSCGNSCGDGQQCCGGSCIDLSDPNNCGACGTDCTSEGESCCPAGVNIYSCIQQPACIP